MASLFSSFLTMALQVRNNLRTNSCKSLANPSFIHLFSSKSVNTSEPNDRDNSSTPPTTSQSSISSYFSDVKASLKQPQQPASPSKSRKLVFSSASSANSFQSKPSIDEIRKNLSEFQRRSSGPPPPPNDWGSAPPSSSSSSSSQNIPLQELFRRNAMKNSDDSNVSSDSIKGRPVGVLSFQAIRESLQHLKSSRSRQSESKVGDSMSLSAFRSSLKLKPSDSAGASSSTMVIGGTDTLPSSVFGKEMMERSSTGSPMMNTEFVKTYSPAELGEKLRKLRPVDGGKSFSLAELNERLMKLREMEEMEIESIPLKKLRESLVKIRISDEEQEKQSSIQKLSILGQLGGTPNFMQKPPKDQLVEKYFHPDNMSSTEKLKIDLAKVRDDFKISESDCGSARVQVAQLTTKIKHLSSVLHKKDKHSRKGLLGMVQKRKKLLKYLRRTDWDSYCFVLSKLGLRDNPDYKN